MGKNIIVCCDGTGQKFEDNKANPLRFHYCLKNSNEQVSFYDPGVGTFDPDDESQSQGWIDEMASTLSKKVAGGGLGYGVVQNIQDAYEFLMSVYEEGDDVFLIGFSRGAFTVQAVAGMLNKCGLLYPQNNNLIPYAIQIYLKKDNDNLASEFKRTMARECQPKMLGVWDTVKSLGDNHKDDFFYDSPTNNSEYGYHALSIDEQRADFVPSRWGDSTDENHIEVWFPGVHADVGGGYPEPGLANAALQWMIAKARARGVVFDEERVKEFTPDPEEEQHKTMTGGWVLRGAEPRQIPAGAKVHQAAETRRQSTQSDYDPLNWPQNPDVVSD